jgi:hypothetical protein
MLQRFDSSLGKDALNFLPLVGIEIGNNRTQKKKPWDLLLLFWV